MELNGYAHHCFVERNLFLERSEIAFYLVDGGCISRGGGFLSGITYKHLLLSLF